LKRQLKNGQKAPKMALLGRFWGRFDANEPESILCFAC